MTKLNELQQCECEKLDAKCVDAYFSYSLLPENPSTIVFDNSWQTDELDLGSAVQASETITHLLLTDTALQFNREDYGREGVEDGGIDCIEGDALSRIISMTLLKDVDQTQPMQSGYIYMYNGNLDIFQPYDLQTFVNNTSASINTLNQQVSTLNQEVANQKVINQQIQDQLQSFAKQLNQLQQTLNTFMTNTNNRLAAIEAAIARPSWAPADTRLTWSNINDLSSSYSNKGIYGHNPANLQAGDQEFQ